jgi:predicted Fe-Mo cluster-binding NifX family protein
MKIIIPSTGKSWEDKVDDRFGRARGFLLYDEDKNKLSWLSNETNMNAGHGAGIQAAQLVINTGAEILITGQIGPKAREILEKTNIKIYKCVNSSIKQAYNNFKQGLLKEDK